MQISDTGILLSTRKYGDYNAIAHIFTRTHGALRGMVRGAHGSKYRGVYQAGNILDVEWNARLEEQLGQIVCSMQTPVAARIIENPPALALLTSACTLTEMCLQERDPHPRLYDALWDVCACLVRGTLEWESYSHFELILLAECGFRLDLERCAVTGSSDNLAYVSPKTGRAVSAEAAGTHKAKLLPYPTRGDVDACLHVSGYFLHKWLFASLGRDVPAARARALVYHQEATENIKKYA